MTAVEDPDTDLCGECGHPRNIHSELTTPTCLAVSSVELGQLPRPCTCKGFQEREK